MEEERYYIVNSAVNYCFTKEELIRYLLDKHQIAVVTEEECK
jgi:hypothetical protein